MSNVSNVKKVVVIGVIVIVGLVTIFLLRAARFNNSLLIKDFIYPNIAFSHSTKISPNFLFKTSSEWGDKEKYNTSYQVFATSDSSQHVLDYYRNIAKSQNLVENEAPVRKDAAVAYGWFSPNIEAEGYKDANEVPVFLYLVLDPQKSSTQQALIQELRTVVPELPQDKVVFILQRTNWFHKLV
jgi:hypothetical protein